MFNGEYPLNGTKFLSIRVLPQTTILTPASKLLGSRDFQESVLNEGDHLHCYPVHPHPPAAGLDKPTGDGEKGKAELCFWGAQAERIQLNPNRRAVKVRRLSFISGEFAPQNGE